MPTALREPPVEGAEDVREVSTDVAFPAPGRSEVHVHDSTFFYGLLMNVDAPQRGQTVQKWAWAPGFDSENAVCDPPGAPGSRGDRAGCPQVLLFSSGLQPHGLRCIFNNTTTLLSSPGGAGVTHDDRWNPQPPLTSTCFQSFLSSCFVLHVSQSLPARRTRGSAD